MSMSFSSKGSGGGAQTISIPLTSLAHTETVLAKYYVDAGETLELTAVGVVTAGNTAPANLSIIVDTPTETLADESELKVTGSPIASVDGATAVNVKIENQTGAPVDASGFAEFIVD